MKSMSKIFQSFENQLAQFGRNHIGTYQAVDMELMYTSQRLQQALSNSSQQMNNLQGDELVLHEMESQHNNYCLVPFNNQNAMRNRFIQYNSKF
ncbi:UNKNOWN [Stylonychia lemnae]|uniref:Uncharacterized protein n=1 Tax=Stylonychia lemnae TaxID=5949 RepID=A0A078AWH3_STYLE|nr:UNKNOWN [Stylonychia lemnae]|eukprot:CDW85602.1 UNKNOWN [Stylonychia lemnae]